MSTPLAELIQLGDLDGLTVEVDRLANGGEWDLLLHLRDRCLRAAEETGRQLFGPAQYAAYRVALEAPGAVACSVLTPGAAPFALGPLTEVVAQHHTWDELADHLAAIEPVAAAVAQERILRGEDLSGDGRAALDAVALPGRLQPWEPSYALPTYRADQLLESGPATPDRWGSELTVAPGKLARGLDELTVALRALAAPWEEQSTGEVHVAAVEGDAPSAIAALLPATFRVAPLGLAEAFDLMAWAAASGGAHGRRRGMAAGRGAAFWVGQLATGTELGGDPDELEFHLEELGWYAFDDGGDSPGWRLRLAVASPDHGWAVAIDAHDTRQDPDDEHA